MLLYIVFVMAEIRNVLVSGNPGQPEPITIWDEARPPEANGYPVIYR